MASSSLESGASRFIQEILALLIEKNYTVMTEKVTGFTKYLFNNMDLLYSSINEEFRKSGVVNLLIESMINFNEQSKRDTLRLLSLFLKTNNRLRDDVTQNTDFIQFLLNKLSNKDVWVNIEKIKYYINILSYLLLSKSIPKVYETNVVRKIVEEIIVESKWEEKDWKHILCIIFYASVGSNVNTEITYFSESTSYDIKTKTVTDTFDEIIRDYLYDFKVFYDNPANEKNHYLKYRVKVEYTFDQICQCMVYYAQNCIQMRHNLFQSGLYELLSKIFLIPHVPEIFLLSAIDIFGIPSLDVSLKARFAKEHQVIIDKFKNYQTNKSTLVKLALGKLVSSFQNNSSIPAISISQQSSQTDIPDNLNIMSSKVSSYRSNLWASLDVKNWLCENKLDSLMIKFSPLTGRGLHQLKSLMSEKNGKFQLIDLLTSKLNVDLIEVLELIGALECLDSEFLSENS